MTNQKRARFLKAIEKTDRINIVLYYKPRGKLLEELFFNQKKQYTIDFYIICNFDKQITYMLTDFLNTIYNIQIWGYINIYCNFTVYLSHDQYILQNAAYIFIKYIVLS